MIESLRENLKFNIILFANIIFINFYSCQQNTNKIITEKINISETEPTEKTIPFKEKWAREILPTKWIEVKKDSKGFLIYLPCDGNTRVFDFRKDKGVAEFTNQIEAPFMLKYENWNSIQNDNWFWIQLFKNGKIILSVKGTEYDNNNQVVLFQLNDEKILVTPFENYDNYRKIENVCKDSKVSELKFETIN